VPWAWHRLGLVRVERKGSAQAWQAAQLGLWVQQKATRRIRDDALARGIPDRYPRYLTSLLATLSIVEQRA